jgi:opacity protein-like surface antigen
MSESEGGNMKGVFLVLAVAMLTAALAQDVGAQSAADQNSQSNRTTGAAQYQNPDATTKSAPASTSVIRGCLSGSPGNYTLTDQNGMQYQIAGDDATLRSMVGREVEISGVENQTSQAGDSTSRLANGVQASDVRAVSPTCKKGSSVSAPPPADNNGTTPKGASEADEPPKQQ